MLQRICRYKEKIFDMKKIWQTDLMMKNILVHANSVWREHGSTVVQVLDQKIRTG